MGWVSSLSSKASGVFRGEAVVKECGYHDGGKLWLRALAEESISPLALHAAIFWLGCGIDGVCVGLPCPRESSCLGRTLDGSTCNSPNSSLWILVWCQAFEINQKLTQE